MKPLTPAQFNAVLKAMADAPKFKFRRALVERLQSTVVHIGKRAGENEAFLKATAAHRGGRYFLPESVLASMPPEAELRVRYDGHRKEFLIGTVLPVQSAIRQGLFLPPKKGGIIH